MRTITVSTDVFAKLWANRADGEETEDDILRRILGCPRSNTEGSTEDKPQGFYDARNKVNFPEGFEIYRHYKGKEYRAKATSGHWVLINTGETFTSLNQLTNAVSDGRENVWVSWNYLAEDGKEAKITGLRNLSFLFSKKGA